MRNSTVTISLAVMLLMPLLIAPGVGCAEGEPTTAQPVETGEAAVPSGAQSTQADELISIEVRRFRTLSGRLVELGGLDAAGATPDSLRARIELIPTIIEEIDRLDQALPALLRSLPEPTPPEDIELIGRIRNTDRAMMAAGFELLSMYERHFGEWAVTPDGVVEFEGLPDEDIRRVNVLLGVISRAATEQAELQQAYIARRSGSRGDTSPTEP
ncbi:MAG: hypothetical protein AAGA55_04700 [Planctomycetota bacterium]